VPLTPANGLGQPRPTHAQFVQSEPVVDKANSPADQESVREIRELIAADKALSVTSRQVTIVARDGRVWLRGQVTTAKDRASLERLARQAGGVIDVKNELVVME
jgi:osmotically-inducible protein OsmY